LEIWHNPRCSKSREALGLLRDAGVEPGVRRYLEEPPTAAELDAVLTAIGREPWEVARTGELVAKELGLAGWVHDRARWIEAMVAHPVLIERPIVIADDGGAVIGRPPERVRDLLRAVESPPHAPPRGSATP
jgi:arsenate reductase (glutaredoxin)